MSVLIINTAGKGMLSDTTEQEVSNIADIAAKSERVVLHVHGGLVSKAEGMATALRLDPFYRQKGIIPIFFVWESSVWETLRSNADRIFNERIFQILLAFLLKHAAGKVMQDEGGRATGTYELLNDQEVALAIHQAREATRETSEPMRQIPIGRNVSEMTEDEENKFSDDLAGSPDLAKAVDEIMLGMEVPPPPGGRAPAAAIVPQRTLMSHNIQMQLRSSAAPGERSLFHTAAIVGHAVSILVRIIKRFARKRDHGLYTTVVEELLRELYFDAIGGAVWGLMKEATLDTFAENTPGVRRGGLFFLQELGARLLVQENKPKLSLVTHSAGTIWACNFLQCFSRQRTVGNLPANFKLDWCVFLAAACTTSLFSSALSTNQTAGLFNNFRAFALSDPLEAGYWEVPPLYPRSLLYLVSGLFEDEADKPIAGMQRFVNQPSAIFHDPAVATVASYLMNPANNSVWSKQNRGGGLESDAERHGGFDETIGRFVTTMQSVRAIL